MKKQQKNTSEAKQHQISADHVRLVMDMTRGEVHEYITDHVSHALGGLDVYAALHAIDAVKRAGCNTVILHLLDCADREVKAECRDEFAEISKRIKDVVAGKVDLKDHGPAFFEAQGIVSWVGYSNDYVSVAALLLQAAIWIKLDDDDVGIGEATRMLVAEVFSEASNKYRGQGWEPTVNHTKEYVAKLCDGLAALPTAHGVAASGPRRSGLRPTKKAAKPARTRKAA